MGVKGRQAVLAVGVAGSFLMGVAGAICGPVSAAVPLPDSRAWEMVSPLEKNGGDIVGNGQFSGGGVAQVAANGEAVVYIAQSSFAEPFGASASQYLSTRHGVKGWSTQNITTPAIAGTNGLAGQGTPYKAFSPDLSLGLVLNGWPTASEAPIENPPLPLPPGEQEAPPGYQNFYLRTGIDGSLRPLLTFRPERPAQGFFMEFEAASPDLKHVVVSSDSALTPGAVVERSRPNLFEWAGGEWQAINVMPEATEGRTKPTAVLGSGNGETRTVSTDGLRVFWSDAFTEADKLLVRKNGTETVQIDASQGGAALPREDPGTHFQTASSDGSLAFFTSHAPLTSDARTGPPCNLCTRQGSDLYEFNVGSGTLRDLSADPNLADQNGAEVQGVLGASEDGSYVYFVASAVLAGANREGRSPSSGDNLYLWHESPGGPPITFVASLSGNDRNAWSPSVRRRTARLTPDGRTVAFMSDASPTGYNNVDAITQTPDEEVYLYNATSGRLSCASCNPSGARPVGASSIPGGAPFELRPLGEGAVYQPRALSDDGRRVFFNSNDALLRQDINGAQDVYQYEEGQVNLLSSGTGEEGAEFVDASASGNDVFFLTRQQLVRGDTDQLVDLYDSRVNGGIAEPPALLPCEDESCKPPASPQPVFAPRGSAIFKGAGNLAAPNPVKKAKPKPKRRHAEKRRRGRRARVARSRR